MCSIAGIYNMNGHKRQELKKEIDVMNQLQKHRGPDDTDVWEHPTVGITFGHNRLSIIDLSSYARQPMQDEKGNVIVYNGEVYNYLELRRELSSEFSFKTGSDTEVVLKAYEKWGEACVKKFKGMFAFVIWDEKEGKLFCARDRFGIKPFYYTIQNNIFYFASEIKALLPFLTDIETDVAALKEYLTFQFCLKDKTLFREIKSLEPAHQLTLCGDKLLIEEYWQIYYDLDWNHTEKYFVEQLDTLLQDSIRYHIRSDVPIGGYVSGGVDSSVISAFAADIIGGDHYAGFVGKFPIGKLYDESSYAEDVANEHGFVLHQQSIDCIDFIENINRVIYHLDEPVAGPGSFCQFMVSRLAAKHRKVVLGGQGGDEIFGGYTRYLIAYFEQCIKGAIEGTMDSGNFIVTYESIIPNLTALGNYKPMIKEFWKEGLFEEVDKRYFRLINRAPKVQDCVRWEVLGDYDPYSTFREIFYADNLRNICYFDNMTHFDFKTLLPALLQVEDRMSMAHGLESRVPLLDHELVEFAATIPANFKLKDGDMKHIFKKTMKHYLPESIQKRKDKMGFPIPLNQWIHGEAKDFVFDILGTEKAKNREYIDNMKVLNKIEDESAFGRNIWGMLSLELWQRQFHDRAYQYKNMMR